MQRKKVRNKREKERNKRKKNSLSSGNPYTVKFMVLILDGSSLKDAPERRNLFYSNCLRHLIRSEAVTKWIFLSENAYFPSLPAQHFMSYHLIYVPP